MVKYEVEPWPSTYNIKRKLKPRNLTSKVEGRKVGAFRGAIPPLTVEPPQVHLVAPRDGEPFEELLTDFDKSFLVAYFDMKKGETNIKEYLQGQDIIIPEYKIHWLINKHDKELEFTCEYAPHPWDGENDEPEFQNLDTLLQFIKKKGLKQKLIDAS
ncbi:MAG: hypothetical protein JSW73_05045 [Candidatus Woesearchaeota archaeon]|nr:MAG: hypothetical protein JSW73_05045 [Candidatus Woesearchaeota archaeon]